MAVHMPILAQARYSVPLIPFVSILASVALVNARTIIKTSGVSTVEFAGSAGSPVREVEVPVSTAREQR